MAQVIVEVLLKLRITSRGLVVLGQLPQRVHQRFGHVTAAIRTESAMFIGDSM
jgi:hypothetical protein